MKLNAHLTFNGQCEAAFQFYERCFDGKILTMLSYGNSPMADQVPPDWSGKITHATLTFGDNVLMGADAFPGQYEKPKGFQMLLHLEDRAEAERLFATLSENGTVPMPLQKTFWADLFGVLVDQYGVPWEINCTAAQ
jgi:PhnB protein